MQSVSRWRTEAPSAPPAVLAALPASADVPGFDVGATVFTSPTAGWALVGGLRDHWLLRTNDAGMSWRPQLTWQGQISGGLSGLDGAAGLLIGLRPPHDTLNGHRVGAGDFGLLAVSTVDEGDTWTVGTPPQPKHLSGMFHYLAPGRFWAIVATPGRYPSRDVVRTNDGGASWEAMACPGELPMTRVAFATAEHGVLIGADGFRDDVLYATRDGGEGWARVDLAPPPGVPATADTLLTPVMRAGAAALLVLKALPRRRSTQVSWAGHYGYVQDGEAHTWSGPYRLPISSMGPDLPFMLKIGADRRFWAASGHELWVTDALDQPWQRHVVPLPGVRMLGASWDPRLAPAPTETVIADVDPVGDGVVWLTTTHGTALGGVPSGELYRSEDSGAHWTKLTVVAR